MVRKKSLPQQTWASGVSSAVAPKMAIRGRVEQIVVTINDNTGDKTATLTITGKAAISTVTGAILYTKASIPEDAATIYKGTGGLGGSTDGDFPAFLAEELCTFTITPSGDPSTSGMTVDVDLYINDSESGL